MGINPVPPFSGPQPQAIPVPKRIQYQYWDGEDGPWAMIPYAVLYPPPPPKIITRVPRPLYQTEDGLVRSNMPVQFLRVNDDGVAWLPPPIHTTDLWSANQTWPL